MTVGSVVLADETKQPLKFERRAGKIWIDLPKMEKTGATKRYEMPDGRTTISLPADAQYRIDPHGWVLKTQ